MFPTGSAVTAPCLRSCRDSWTRNTMALSSLGGINQGFEKDRSPRDSILISETPAERRREENWPPSRTVREFKQEDCLERKEASLRISPWRGRGPGASAPSLWVAHSPRPSPAANSHACIRFKRLLPRGWRASPTAPRDSWPRCTHTSAVIPANRSLGTTEEGIADVIKSPSQLTLREGDYPGGPESFKAESFLQLVPEEEVRAQSVRRTRPALKMEAGMQVAPADGQREMGTRGQPRELNSAHEKGLGSGFFSRSSRLELSPADTLVQRAENPVSLRDRWPTEQRASRRAVLKPLDVWWCSCHLAVGPFLSLLVISC